MEAPGVNRIGVYRRHSAAVIEAIVVGLREGLPYSVIAERAGATKSTVAYHAKRKRLRPVDREAER